MLTTLSFLIDWQLNLMTVCTRHSGPFLCVEGVLWHLFTNYQLNRQMFTIYQLDLLKLRNKWTLWDYILFNCYEHSGLFVEVFGSIVRPIRFVAIAFVLGNFWKQLLKWLFPVSFWKEIGALIEFRSFWSCSSSMNIRMWRIWLNRVVFDEMKVDAVMTISSFHAFSVLEILLEVRLSLYM